MLASGALELGLKANLSVSRRVGIALLEGAADFLIIKVK
jgi:hypothetical protein